MITTREQREAALTYMLPREDWEQNDLDWIAGTVEFIGHDAEALAQLLATRESAAAERARESERERCAKACESVAQFYERRAQAVRDDSDCADAEAADVEIDECEMRAVTAYQCADKVRGKPVAHPCALAAPRPALDGGEVAKRCEWYQCDEPAVTERTDIGGTTFALCAEHERKGEKGGARLSYWRPKAAPAPEVPRG